MTDPPSPLPAPPHPLNGSSTGTGDEEADGDRPVYRRGWFYMAAAGLATLTIAWIRHSTDDRNRDDGLLPKHDPGFPPPPGSVTTGWPAGERSNR